MKSWGGLEDIEFGGPATYRIVVKGSISPAWAERLGNLRISSVDSEGCTTHTILSGPIRDQAELSGILTTLYGLHLPIVRVEQVASEPEPGGSR